MPNATVVNCLAMSQDTDYYTHLQRTAIKGARDFQVMDRNTKFAPSPQAVISQIMSTPNFLLAGWRAPDSDPRHPSPSTWLSTYATQQGLNNYIVSECIEDSCHMVRKTGKMNCYLTRGSKKKFNKTRRKEAIGINICLPQ
jgi:hypothetical protein